MQSVLVLDFGSQYTQLIARRIRELGIYSEILPYNTTPETIREHAPKAIILSGGPTSVYGESAILPHEGIFSLGLPILGICYGLQAIAKHFGGEVASSAKQEFGRAKMLVSRDGEPESMLFRNIPDSDVWMSHGDKVVNLPDGFRITASSANSEMCALETYGSKGALKVFGLQFHPEVQHTLYGKQLLSNFLIDIAGITPTGRRNTLSIIRSRRYAEQPATKPLSAASAEASTLLSQPSWSAGPSENLHCVFVDNGLLRKTRLTR